MKLVWLGRIRGLVSGIWLSYSFECAILCLVPSIYARQGFLGHADKRNIVQRSAAIRGNYRFHGVIVSWVSVCVVAMRLGLA